MAYQDTHAAQATDLPHRIVTLLKSITGTIGNALVSIAETNSRLRRVDRLNAKSDVELAARGIRREDIIRHVFVDMLDV